MKNIIDIPAILVLACMLTLGGCEGENAATETVPSVDAITGADEIMTSQPSAQDTQENATDLVQAINPSTTPPVAVTPKRQLQAEGYLLKYTHVKERYDLYAPKTAQHESPEIKKRMLYAQQALTEIEKALNGFKTCSDEEAEARMIGLDKNLSDVGVLMEEVVEYLNKG
ncbi:MAG: hypothetical protein O7G85_03000 [Planctomycetota bacterium]|nr:hypothetical protein [Planctomycetota bacterium]